MNTIPAMVIDIERRRPVLANTTGGLSGPAIRPLAVRLTYQLAAAVEIPVVGIGGIMDHRDALQFLLAGASAVQVGTATFTRPGQPRSKVLGRPGSATFDEDRRRAHHRFDRLRRNRHPQRRSRNRTVPRATVAGCPSTAIGPPRVEIFAMNSATESSSQAPPAPTAEGTAPKESRRADWLIVGLDVPGPGAGTPAGAGARPPSRGTQDRPRCCITRAGAAAVDLVHEHGGRVFLDLKWHDIPNTVAEACRAAAEQGVWMVNVHAAGGVRMLAAARDALEQARQPGTARPLLIAVTVLTSLAASDLEATGVSGAPADQAERLAALAERGGADGLVTSGHEVAALHARWPHFNLVVPGIRPRWLTSGGRARVDDQRRVATPAATLAAGASHVVIARPIITHRDPSLPCASPSRRWPRGRSGRQWLRAVEPHCSGCSFFNLRRSSS